MYSVPLNLHPVSRPQSQEIDWSKLNLPDYSAYDEPTEHPGGYSIYAPIQQIPESLKTPFRYPLLTQENVSKVFPEVKLSDYLSTEVKRDMAAAVPAVPVAIMRGPRGGRYMLKPDGTKKYLPSGRRHPGSRYKRRRYSRRYTRRSTRGGRRWNFRISGLGDYKSWGGTALRGLGSIAGGVMGGMAGGPWGALKGAAMGSGLAGLGSSLVGLGDYHVNQNSLMGMVTGGTSAGGVPRVQNLGGRVIINHREYLFDISSTEDFNNLAIDINPGLSKTFPWLSQIAANFEQWRPLGIIVCFETHSSDALNSTNTALGSLIFSSNYNSTDPEYQNQQEALNTEFTTSTKPSCSVLHPLECSPVENPQRIFYVRTGPLGPDANSQLWYDLCKTQIITTGSQAAANIGKIYISYEIEFLKPVSTRNAATGRNIPGAYYQLSGASTADGPLGNAAPTQVFDSIGVSISTDDQSITFPPGMPNAEFLLQFQYIGGSAACSMGQPTYDGETQGLDLFQSGDHFPLGTTSTGTQFNFSLAVQNGLIGLGGDVFMNPTNVLPTAVTTGDLFITRLNPGLAPAGVEEKKEEFAHKSDYEKKLTEFMKLRSGDSNLSDEMKMKIFENEYEPQYATNLELMQYEEDTDETTIGRDRLQEIHDLFGIHVDLSSDKYVPSIEELEQDMKHLEDFPQFISDWGGKPFDGWNNKASYTKDMTTWNRKLLVKEMKSKFSFIKVDQDDVKSSK